MSVPQVSLQEQRRHACTLCARRKVKCDKTDPCANCRKANVQCSYEAPPPPRPRKRAADEELLARLARYEDLMRHHNVDYTAYANTWVYSGLDTRVKKNGSQPSTSPVPIDAQQLQRSTSPQPERQRSLWCNLPSELKYINEKMVRLKEAPPASSYPPLNLFNIKADSTLAELHPEPRHIYRYWQIFVESINPLIKIIHVPTVQQRILDASWDPAKIPGSLAAIMFAIYVLAVTSTPADVCESSFGEDKNVLLERYRAATVQALVAVDFLTSRDFQVLQAFVLFLLADPVSELTSTLASVAIRIGQKMGLHNAEPDPTVSFFEQEMRLRLWWQLHGLDRRSRAVHVPDRRPPLTSDFGDLRMPLNVNDADLHPDMVEPPLEHSGPTEMLFVLLKFQIFHWLRSSSAARRVFGSIMQSISERGEGAVSMALQDEAIDELETAFYGKYLRNADLSIPLHRLSQSLADLAVARLRFKVHRPRVRAALVGDGEVLMTQKEADMLFKAAVIMMDVARLGAQTGYSWHLFVHMISSSHMSKSRLEAYVYVLSELRQRSYGVRVSCAWKLIEDLYNEHPELIDDSDDAFSAAFGDLTLEAWETRCQELLRSPNARESAFTPQFIQSLREKRVQAGENMQLPAIPDPPQDLDQLGLADINDFNWESWNDFLRF